MKKSEKKKALVHKIISPVMEGKGLSLRSYDKGVWIWEKEIDGVMEEVKLADEHGNMSLRIGLSKTDVRSASGTKLLLQMEHPRTSTLGWWHYSLYPEEGKALYEDLLLDIRDILERFCDPILEKNAAEVKKAVPKRRHFEYMRDNREKLVEEYREKLGISGQGILEIYELMVPGLQQMREQPLEAVENELVGYAALLEEEILSQYGGLREVHEDFGTITITNVGHTVSKRTFNMLVRIFLAWKKERKIELLGKELREFVEDDENGRRSKFTQK